MKIRFSSVIAVVVNSFMLTACAAGSAPTDLPVSKSDRINPWFGPRKHYEHVVRDQHGDLKEVYRYYFDMQSRPVLDGERLILRWKHDPGVIYNYRDGHLIGKYKAAYTGSERLQP